MSQEPPAQRTSSVDITKPSRAALFSGSFLMAGCVAIGVAVKLNNGFSSPLALLLICVALAATCAAILWNRSPALLTADGRPFALLLVLAIGVEWAVIVFDWPPVPDFSDGSGTNRNIFTRLEVVSLIFVLLSLFKKESGIVGRTWFPALLLIQLLLGFWLIRSLPNPRIDVFMFQQDGGKALLRGVNPYTVHFANPYRHTRYYGPGLATNQELLFGFPYPPLSLMLSTIGVALGDDHRYAQLGAMIAAAVLLALSRRHRNAKLAAALLLLTPPLQFILNQAWTEPFVVLCFAATVFLACRKPKLLPLALGSLLASKQYMPLILPLTFLLLPHPWRWRDWARLLVSSGLVAAVETLPFAVFHWDLFIRSVVTVHMLAPSKPMALGFPAIWFSLGAPAPGLALELLGIGAALALCIWKSPRNVSGFCASAALVYLAVFSCGKHAAANYYLVPIAALCGALAATGAQAMAPVAASSVPVQSDLVDGSL